VHVSTSLQPFSCFQLYFSNSGAFSLSYGEREQPTYLEVFPIMSDWGSKPGSDSIHICMHISISICFQTIFKNKIDTRNALGLDSNKNSELECKQLTIHDKLKFGELHFNLLLKIKICGKHKDLQYNQCAKSLRAEGTCTLF
jgi:hypothetical protein